MAVTLAKSTDVPGMGTGTEHVNGVDWHVYVASRWLRVVEPSQRCSGPVNVWVSETLMRPVIFRHRASNCHGSCPLGQ